MQDVSLTAPDISCGHCRKTIEEGLRDQPGIGAVSVDIPARAVQVRYDEAVTSEQAIRLQLDELGYPVAQPG